MRPLKMRHLQKTKYAIGLVFFLFLFSCSKEDKYHEIETYISKVKLNVQKQKKNIKAFKIQEPFVVSYSALKLRDPFKDPAASSGKGGPKSLNELINYPISMLKFVGTLMKDGILYAYILAPDGKMYQIKEGELIGDRQGKILHIYSNRLEITEHDTSGSGATQRIVTLQLKERE